jgi:hypothetical protein
VSPTATDQTVVQTPANGPNTQPPSRRRTKLWVVSGAVAAALVAAGLVWLFGAGKGEGHDPGAAAALPFVDGTLSTVEQNRLVIKAFKPLAGRREVEFTIRPQDEEYFDIAHLQSHSAVALPVRIYYRRSGERYLARYADDAPVNSNK